MRKYYFIICMMLMITVLLTSCGGTAENTGGKKIVDCVGVEVTVPKNPQKVVCVTQNAMEFMIAMGQEDKIIGVHKSIWAHTWSSEFLTRMDSFEPLGYSPAMEKIYEMAPDLVIVRDATTAEEFRNVGITAITFKYTNEDELFKAVNMLGDIFGTEAKSFAIKWIDEYISAKKDVQTALANISDDDKVNLYFIDASVAIDAGGLCTTVGGDHIVAEWLKTSGAKLVTEKYTDISEINEEVILKINPDAIMIGGWSENTRKEQLLADVKWSDVNAVKNNRIYTTPVGYISFERYGVEAPILIRYTTSQLYPDKYSYDTVSEFQKFFKEFYGMDVSEEKINYMLAGLSPDGTRMD